MAGKYLSAYYDGNNGNKIYLELHVYTIATSIANNTTTERADLYANVVDSSYQWYNGYGTEAFIGINGNNTTKTVTFDYRTNGVKNLISSWDTVVKHDNSGKASIGISAHHYSGVGLGNASVSGTYDCDTIQRYANFTTHSINSVTETKVIVTWGADAECDAIQYSLNNGTWTTISGYPNYTVSGLSPGTSYTIKTKIRRKDSQLWTESEALSFTTYSYPTQQFNNKSESYIVMNWSADSTVSEIYFSTNNGSTWSSKISVNATSGTYSIMNLSANTTYNVKTRIKRKNTNFYSDTSAITIKTYSYPTQTIKNVTETSVNVSWSADSTIDLLYYSTNNGSTWSEAISANAINGNYTISNLTPNTSYKIMTRFRRKENQSYSNSSSASITTYDYPHITTTPNFTIGDKVYLSLYNPLKRNCTCIMYGNDWSEIYNDDGWTGTSIGDFTPENITDKLYASIPNDSQGTYHIKIRYNGVDRDKKNAGTYTINRIKCIPIFQSFNIKDINSTTLALTGNNQIIVKGLSNVQIDIKVSQKAIAQNSSTIVKYVVVSGNKTLEISYSDSNTVSTVINSIQSTDVVVYAVDSRGLSSQLRQKVFDFRDWSEPVFDTTKVIRENGIGTKGLLDLKVNFWVGNFGTVENEIKKISYKYKKRTSTSFSEYIDITDRMIRSEGNDYYILRKTSCPGVIIECGFLSCPEEESKLMDDGYQNKIVDAIVEVILEMYY